MSRVAVDLVHPLLEEAIASHAIHLSNSVSHAPHLLVSPIEATEASGGACGVLRSRIASTSLLTLQVLHSAAISFAEAAW